MDKEAPAIVFEVNKFHCICIIIQFLLHTDHKIVI